MLISSTIYRPRTLTYISNTNPHLKASLQPDICNDEDIQVIKISTPTIEPVFLFNIYNESPPHDRTLPYTVERVSKEVWTQLHECGGYENLESSAVYLTRMIQTATALHVPPKKTTVRSKPWWSQEIDEKRKIMHHRWREWKETRTTPARNQFNAVRNYFYTTIREAKSKNWDDFLQSARGKEVFTARRYTKSRRVDPTPDITIGEEKAKTFKEKAQLFRKALFPPPPTLDIQEDEYELPTRRLPWPRLTQREIRNAIISSSSTKAPGPDGLGFECIKMAYRAIPDYFHTLYEVLLRYRYHPKAWREATIVIIKKNGKPEYSAPKAYRPISLLNCLGTISEKIIATRLAHMAEKHHLLHNLQISRITQERQQKP